MAKGWPFGATSTIFSIWHEGWKAVAYHERGTSYVPQRGLAQEAAELRALP
ncbi:hypothetical protein ACIBI9_37390 [Nonomuraea sp. NPDC050451]|uniref:hypothetical protein n=1 Tax=Nonomuraea sp. NPDC050451 TaxID=3364364 RepID=UPI0037A5865F